jgi:hypothetical protein
MKMRTTLGLLFALLWAGGTAPAGTIWYNGDFDNVDGTVSVRHGFGLLDIDAYVYENVILTNSQTVTGIFGTFLYSGESPVGAEYEIRSGVSTGDGGTLVASGALSSGFSWTSFGVGFDSPSYGTLGVYRLDIGGLSVALEPGEYWVGLRPEALTGSDVVALLGTTSGTNAIGTPPGNDGNSYLDSSLLGFTFDPANADFSVGITDVPEPSTLLLAGLGLLAAATARARSQARQR